MPSREVLKAVVLLVEDKMARYVTEQENSVRELRNETRKR